jgi:hypothetical protein
MEYAKLGKLLLPKPNFYENANSDRCGEMVEDSGLAYRVVGWILVLASTYSHCGVGDVAWSSIGCIDHSPSLISSSK